MATKSILEEAVDDVTALKKAAEENAKNYLVEAMSPRIKDFISSHLGQEGVDAAMALDAQGQNGTETMAPADETADMYEIDDANDADEESEIDFSEDDCDGESDGDDDDDGDVHIDIDKDEGHHHKMSYEDDEANESVESAEQTEEQVEITSEDLRKAFAGVLKGLQKESTLTPGKLGEPDDPNEGDVGLGGKIVKDTQWAEVVPQKVKMHAKEALEKRVASLSKQLEQYKEAYQYLKKNLNEMNLFNAKLIYTTRLLQNNLSPKQKLSVVESIDSASNKKEVELVYKTLSESLKIAGVTERQTGLKGPKASRFTKPSSTLNESLQQQDNNAQLDRMALLAGITE